MRARGRVPGARARGAVALAVAALAWLAACDRPDDIATPVEDGLPDGATLFPVLVHEPPSLSGVDVGQRDHQGRPAPVECATCHSLRAGAPLPATAEGLEAVHAGLAFDHGELSCASCHDADRPEALHLADGRPLDMADAMDLCGQCHGPQARDWQHGSHGGVRGHWDRRRGPAERNHCVDCHDPHRPAFPTYLPLPPPRDRFLDTGHDEGERQGGE